MESIRFWITVAELFSDPVAHLLLVLNVARDEVPEVDGIADANEDLPLGELAWPLGTVHLALQLENHLRQPLLRWVQVDVSRLPAPHVGDSLERCQIVLEPRTAQVAVLPPLPQQAPQQ